MPLFSAETSLIDYISYSSVIRYILFTIDSRKELEN